MNGPLFTNCPRISVIPCNRPARDNYSKWQPAYHAGSISGNTVTLAQKMIIKIFILPTLMSPIQLNATRFVYIVQCKPPNNIYFFHYYNGSGTVMARWDWKIPTSSFEVWKYPPLPSASPRDIGKYYQTSQESVGIFQSHLAMTVPLSQY